MDIIIKHNTYLKKTEFILSSNVNKTLTITKIENSENFIWEWLDKLTDIIHEINVDKINFTIQARQEDCEIFNQYIKENQHKFQGAITKPMYEINKGLELQAIKSKIESLLNNINASYLKDNFDLHMKAVHEYLNEPTEIIVIAPMSAGKSTLINSMIGSEVLASGNEACTSIITKIIHADMEKPVYSIDDNKTWEPYDYKIVKKLHKDTGNNTHIKQITIKHKLSKLVDNVGNDNSFVFIDTPGTNNASNKEHCKTTFDYIHGNTKVSKFKTNPIVLFVANITNGDVTEDSEIILKEVSKVLENAKNSTISDRFIFILNKADAETSKDKDFDEIEEALQDHITKWFHKLSESGYNIKNPKIFPISAEHSLLANRESQLGKKSRDILNNLKEYLDEDNLFNLSNLSNLNDNDKKQLAKQFNGKNLTQQVEYYSGVPAVEYYIKNYVSKYTLPTKLNGILSEISNKLEFAFKKVNNVETILNLNGKIDENKYTEFKAKTHALIQKLQNSKAIEDVKEKSNNLNFNEEINPVFNNMSSSLNEEMDQFITWLNKKLHSFKDAIHADIFDKFNKELEKKIFKFIDNIPKVTSQFESDVEEKNRQLSADLIAKSETAIIDLFTDEELQTYGIKETLKMSNDFSNIVVDQGVLKVKAIEVKTKSNLWYEFRDNLWDKYGLSFIWTLKRPKYYEKSDIEEGINALRINMEGECDKYTKAIQITAENNFKDFKLNLNKSIDDIIEKISDYVTISKTDQELINHKDTLDKFQQALDDIFLDVDQDQERI